MIGREEAIAIATEDARTVVRDQQELDRFAILTSRKGDRWHVEFKLKEGFVGGGLQYVIDPRTGEIVSRKMFQ